MPGNKERFLAEAEYYSRAYSYLIGITSEAPYRDNKEYPT